MCVWLPEEVHKGFTAPNCRSDLPARMRNFDLHGDTAFEAVGRAVGHGCVWQQSNELVVFFLNKSEWGSRGARHDRRSRLVAGLGSPHFRP